MRNPSIAFPSGVIEIVLLIFPIHILCVEIKNKMHAYMHMEREAFYYNETYEDFVHFSRDLFGTFVNCYK